MTLAPKTDRFASRRSRARAAGLCVTCCTRRLEEGRSVCARCAKTATERTARRRVVLRERKRLDEVIKAHERAGDTAREHHLYEDATQHYRDALQMRVIAPLDHARISEKLAYALSLGRNPRAASPVFDRVLASYRGDPASAEKVVEILLQGARQLYIDAKMEAALPLLTQAIEVADKSGESHLRKIADIRMANYLIGLCRYEEAAHLLEKVGGVGDADEASTQTEYFTQKAILAAQFGRAETAYEHFERAMHIAENVPDIYQLATAWMTYGFHAMDLGNIEKAKACIERALLLARRHHITWFIPHVCLRYAQVLFCVGHYGAALEYLLDALSYDTRAPMLTMRFAEFGIPIALKMRDETALSRCAHLSTIDCAFQSGAPQSIGSVTSAFAQWHIAQGRVSEAEMLLHRAVEVIPARLYTGWVNNFQFPLSVARYGLFDDVPRARNLITWRARSFSSPIVQACLQLFDAFTAHRGDRNNETLVHAAEAQRQFEAFGWHYYAHLAQALLPGYEKSSEIVHVKPFANMLSVLTAREQQVAELVLKGYGNRAIADALSIKERTVESHMTSIMNHLGVRSRHQLTGAIVDSTMRV